MSLIVELLALAQGLYFLIGAVIVLGGLALFAVELLRHLRREEARTDRTFVANVYVNHVHIHMSARPGYGDGRDTQQRLPLADGAEGSRRHLEQDGPGP